MGEQGAEEERVAVGGHYSLLSKRRRRAMPDIQYPVVRAHAGGGAEMGVVAAQFGVVESPSGNVCMVRGPRSVTSTPPRLVQ